MNIEDIKQVRQKYDKVIEYLNDLLSKRKETKNCGSCIDYKIYDRHIIVNTDSRDINAVFIPIEGVGMNLEHIKKVQESHDNLTSWFGELLDELVERGAIDDYNRLAEGYGYHVEAFYISNDKIVLCMNSEFDGRTKIKIPTSLIDKKEETIETMVEERKKAIEEEKTQRYEAQKRRDMITYNNIKKEYNL
tara:strand:- start:22570 stop:23142 length:573 start_codon:yes stop_codon:yes gene_type:complete